MPQSPSAARPRVIVVGAGVGGLAAAIELAGAGTSVLVLERGESPGGKLRGVTVAGAVLDAGPTVLTMRWVFEELFARHQRALGDYVGLESVDLLARHSWPDGATLDLFSDEARSADAIGAQFGARAAGQFRAFSKEARGIYDTIEGPFLRAQRPSWGGLLKEAGRIGLGSFARIDAHRTMWRALTQHFESPHLRQLFGRYATYCGASPFEAPATFNLVSHVEAQGVYRVRGGMHQLAAGLARLAGELGATLTYGTGVRQIIAEGGRVRGVVTDQGSPLLADAVVLNADVAALASGLFGTDAGRLSQASTSSSDRSLSAVTFVMLATTSGLPLTHHNVLFSADAAAEFQVLAEGRMPADPTVYVCAQERPPGESPDAEQRLLIVLNAPATGDLPSRWSEPERQTCEMVMRKAAERCGLLLKPSVTLQTTPLEFAQRFPGTGGALYGSRPRGPLSALKRPAARTALSGLYLAGGSVHPGPGVPMATLSGVRAAEALLADQPSTAHFRAVATSGTTSTVAARMGPSRSS